MEYPLYCPGEVALPGLPRLGCWPGDDRGVFRVDGEPRRVCLADGELLVSEWARIEDAPWEVRKPAGEGQIYARALTGERLAIWVREHLFVPPLAHRGEDGSWWTYGPDGHRLEDSPVVPFVDGKPCSVWHAASGYVCAEDEDHPGDHIATLLYGEPGENRLKRAIARWPR